MTEPDHHQQQQESTQQRHVGTDSVIDHGHYYYYYHHYYCLQHKQYCYLLTKMEQSNAGSDRVKEVMFSMVQTTIINIVTAR